jgi:carbonic anhydrase
MAQAIRSSGAGLVILSCADPRLNPYQIFGIDPSVKGVTMVRNAGGRAVDAIRTISVLQTIGNPKTVVVLHHTGKLNTRDGQRARAGLMMEG